MLSGRFARIEIRFQKFRLREDISESIRDILSGLKSMTQKCICNNCGTFEKFDLNFITVFIESDNLKNLCNAMIKTVSNQTNQ